MLVKAIETGADQFEAGKITGAMSKTVSISQQDAAGFRDNLLRVQIVCNSLRAFAAEDWVNVATAAEAKTFERFLAEEMPVVMQQNEAILHEAIRARGDGEIATRAALGLLREDHERLGGLVAQVCGRLRAATRSRGASGRDELRRGISAFLAAQRNYMVWSRRIVNDAGG